MTISGANLNSLSFQFAVRPKTTEYLDPRRRDCQVTAGAIAMIHPLCFFFPSPQDHLSRDWSYRRCSYTGDRGAMGII
uniref:Uncharacterized protein n=1 Tax=Arundo donax TaxID=35708 RepID=A0A0A8ZDS4_ARUDO